MSKHLVLINDSELANIISGKAGYLVKFFKKRTETLGKIASGDLIYFKKKQGEILGQFEIGKLITIEKLDVGDWKLIQEVGGGMLDLRKEVFSKKLEENNILLIIQIIKLEQFITSPIEAPRGRKEWMVLDDR